MTKNTWILLSEARNRLLNMWLAIFAIMTIFLLIQTSTGVIAGIRLIVWGWHFLCLFPGLVLLLGNTWLKKHTDEMLNYNIYRSLFGLETFYLLLVLLVFILSRKAIATNDYGLDVYYPKSLWILLPINFILICGLGVVILFNKSILKPNTDAILQLAKEKSDYADINQYTHQSFCFDCIRKGDIEAAIEKASNWFEKKSDRTYHDLILLQGQYNLLQQEINLNTIGKTESQIQLNKTMIALIDIVKDIQG